MAMIHTRIPPDELKVFESLTNVKVVFDVGTRDDVDYLIIKPKIKLHAFEPNPLFFEQLSSNVDGLKNVYLNNFGCGSKEGTYSYSYGSQATLGKSKTGILIKRLDKYIEENNIKQIDFLKIDTEGFELETIRGLGKYIKICRYIQYEKNCNGDDEKIEKILKRNGFKTYYTGYRNQLAVRNGEKMPWIPTETQEGGQPEKDINNYLKTT